jgi:PAT family beta-lactamase induction signal transducer AmpG
MLGRFVPLGVREPNFDVSAVPATAFSPSGLLRPGIAAAAALTVASVLLLAALDAMETMRATPAEGFDFGASLWRLWHPVEIGDWVTLGGVVAFAVVGAMLIAAARARRT